MGLRSLTPSWRWIIPQVLTGSRLAAGAGAILAAFLSHNSLAATLVIMFVVTDALDGPIARRLNATTEFGALFDYFADYLCYVVVPAVVSVGILRNSVGVLALAILATPMVVGGIRYARNLQSARSESFDEVGLPGLGTMFYGFFVFGLVFLDREGRVDKHMLKLVLMSVVPVMSCLMLTPIRYPKLANHNFILVPVIVGLNVMPYWATEILSACTLLLIIVYVVFSPLLLPQPWRK